MTTLKDILTEINPAKFIGNETISIKDVIQLDVLNKRDDVLFWCSDNNINKLKECTNGTVICSNVAEHIINSNKHLNYIVVDKPRYAFANIVNLFFLPYKRVPLISKTAVIHSSVKIGANVFIGENVVIEENVEIGNNTTILHGTVILYNTKIGSNVKIGINNSIGGDGLGYEKDEKGLYQFIPHIGNVVLADNVETGSGCAIDRAVLGNTEIKFNTKLDNFVHVAHGVVIGENCILTANVMIAGSTTIGNNVWIGPSSALMNKIKIGDNSFIGLGSVVIKDVAPNIVVAGNPAKFFKNI